jgi:hypothetical protein
MTPKEIERLINKLLKKKIPQHFIRVNARIDRRMAIRDAEHKFSLRDEKIDKCISIIPDHKFIFGQLTRISKLVQTGYKYRKLMSTYKTCPKCSGMGQFSNGQCISECDMCSGYGVIKVEKK